MTGKRPKRVVRLFLQHTAWDVNELHVSILPNGKKPVVHEHVHVSMVPDDEGNVMLGFGIQPFQALPAHRNRQNVMPVVACPLMAAPIDVSMTIPTGEEEFIAKQEYTRDEQHKWVYGNAEEVTEAIQGKLKEILLQHKATFAYSLKDCTGYKGEHEAFRLNMTGKPPYPRKRRVTPADQAFQDEICAEQRDASIIVPSNDTEYCAENTFPAKKDENGEWTVKRLCQDYREHNKLTRIDPYPIPRQDELMERVGKARYFSKVDLKSGYWQMMVHPEDQHKTTFRWGNETWQFTRLPMGLKNAVAYFQKVMNYEIRKRGLGHFVDCYLDDILIFSETMEEHLQHIQQVLDMLAEVGLRAHPSKSVFLADSVEFLGHNISRHGMSPSEAKVKAIREMATPTSVQQLQTALGLFTYYHDYSPNFSVIAQPLYDLTQKNIRWVWTLAHQQAYDTLKQELSDSNKVVRRADFSKPFLLHTDFSNYGCGAVIGQKDGDQEYVVACGSRSLNRYERHYCSFQGEMLAVVWAVRLFRYYLQSATFTLITDHQPLAWLMDQADLVGQHQRWAMMLQQYDFTITHRAGKEHANADALSRLPLPSYKDPTGARLDTEWQTCLLPTVCCAQAQPMPKVPFGDLEAAQASRTLRSIARLAYAQAGQPTWPWQQLMTQWWQAAEQYGITLIELCGGLSAGLEACLKNNIPIQQYVYADTSRVAQAVSTHRQKQFMATHSDLLDQPTWGPSEYPMNIKAWTQPMVTRMVTKAGGRPVFIVAGWPCQDLSAAGQGAGLAGDRSSLFYHVNQILGWAMAAGTQGQVRFLTENVALEYNHKHDNAQAAAREIHAVWGAP